MGACLDGEVRAFHTRLLRRKAILRDACGIYQGLQTPAQGLYRLARWTERWAESEPDAVRNFAYDFEATLTYLTAPPQWQGRLRTTNPIERFLRENWRGDSNKSASFPARRAGKGQHT